MMPVIFIGHGSPMNAIEDNEFTYNWKKMADSIKKTKAILCISAHWVTENIHINTLEDPKTINDFYGFPSELYEVGYKVKGATEFAIKTKELLGNNAFEDNTWGIDHGAWSVLCRMYKEADIPIYQMSIDALAKPEELFEIGKKLKSLRDEGVLILGSGNVVHNLRTIDFSIDKGYDWAEEFDAYIKENIEKRNFKNVINYKSAGDCSKYSVPTPEHFLPLLYVLGAVNDTDKLDIYNNSCIGGSLSMTSYVFS